MKYLFEYALLSFLFHIRQEVALIFFFPLRLCVLVGSIICDLHYTWQREQDKITVIEEDNGPYRLKFN